MSALTVLTYSSRSGSTFLARQLAAAYDVVVVPEFQCAYPALALPVGTALEPDQVRRLVADDLQLGWVDPSDVDQLVASEVVTPSDLVVWVVRRYAESTGATSGNYLVKLGGLGLTWPHVRDHLPEVRGLNVIRDGRAVVNSLLKTSSPYLSGGLDMGYGDPLWSARTWARDVDAQMRCAATYPETFYSVRYEDVIQDTARVVDEIGVRFGWSPGDGASGFAVALAETEIHRNIDRPALTSRIQGWRSELSREDRLVVEHVVARQLEALGYSEPLQVDRPERVRALVRAFGRHAARQTVGWTHRLRRLRSLDDVRDRFRRRLVRRRSWDV